MSGELIAGVVAIVLTAIGMIAGASYWAILSAMRNEMSPLRETMVGLQKTAESLTRELAEAKLAQQSSRTELHDAVDAIRGMLANHETRITVLERTHRARGASA